MPASACLLLQGACPLDDVRRCGAYPSVLDLSSEGAELPGRPPPAAVLLPPSLLPSSFTAVAAGGRKRAGATPVRCRFYSHGRVSGMVAAGAASDRCLL